MSSINSSLPPELFLPQTASDSNNTSNPTGKPSSQGQGKGTPAVTTTSGTSSYSSFQGAQEQPGTSSQNINTTLSQTLGTVQNSITNSSGDTYDTQDTVNEDAPQIPNIGLTLAQQVIGSQGEEGSDTESGGESEQGQVYIPSAVSSLQQGENSTSSSTSVESTTDISTFTLKVEPSSSQSTSGTSSTSSTSSTTETSNSNGAPAIPPPNVFAMVEESTNLGSVLQMDQVSQMVSSASGQNAILSQDYSQQITDIQNYISAKNSASNKSQAAQAFSWAINISMLVVGTLTADPMLIAAGIMGCVMTADPQITAGLTSALENMGIKPQAVANMMSTLIIVAAASVATCGAGAIAEGALEAGSEAAVDAASNAGAESVSESTTTTAEDKAATTALKDSAANTTDKTASSVNYSETLKALGTSEGRSAFIKGAAEGATKTITEAPGKLAASLYRAPQTLSENAKALYSLAGRISTRCMSLGSKGLLEGAEVSAETGARVGAATAEEASLSERAIAQLQSVATNLASDPLKAVHIASDLTMMALTTAGSVEQYNATILKGKAEKADASVLTSKGETSEISQAINLSNQQIQEVLNDMNADVAGAGQVLAQMSNLSSETLGQMHGAAA